MIVTEPWAVWVVTRGGGAAAAASGDRLAPAPMVDVRVSGLSRGRW
jgi:hypothetical protein